MRTGLPGKLYVVATPIGNLGDITLRALEILKRVGALACEDTRHTKKLLSHYNIHPTEVFSLHKFNERSRIDKLLGLLQGGTDVAMVSDAGTPVLSDPGNTIIASVVAQGIAVEPIPGASAVSTALSASGLTADRFLFDGFLPRKRGERKKRFAELQKEPRTLVFFEAPHRLSESLRDAREVLGNRQAVLARELTKLHEEISRADLDTLLERVNQGSRPRGEMVLMVEGASFTGTVGRPAADIASIVAAFQRLQADGGISRADAIRTVAQRFGITRKETYRVVLKGISAR